LIHGGPAFVDKYWKPGYENDGVSSNGLSKREVLSGRSAFARHGANSDPAFGISWSSVWETIVSTKQVDIDTGPKIKSFLRNKPYRETANDAQAEYLARSYLRICCLFSSARKTVDEEKSNTLKMALNEEILKHARISTSPLTITDMMLTHASLCAKINTAPRLDLPQEKKYELVMGYVGRCMKFWTMMCNHVRPPTMSKSDMARKFNFSDFTVAVMYIFAEGLKLTSTTTDARTEEIIPADDFLKLTLPPVSFLNRHVCDEAAVNSHRGLIKRFIIEAVRDYNLDPLCISQYIDQPDELDVSIFPDSRRGKF
jgi:hypothetical protein